MRERIVASGFARMIEADVVRLRFERSAVVSRSGKTYFVRRMDGTWCDFERSGARSRP